MTISASTKMTMISPPDRLNTAAVYGLVLRATVRVSVTDPAE